MATNFFKAVKKQYEYSFYSGFVLFDELYKDFKNKITYAVMWLLAIISIVIVLPFFTILLRYNIDIEYYQWMILGFIWFYLNDRYFKEKKCDEIVNYFKNNPEIRRKHKFVNIVLCVLALTYLIASFNGIV